MRQRLLRAWDRFFFAPASDAPGGLIRIGFAALCFLNMALFGLDLELFYAPDGLLPYRVGRATVDPDTWSLFGLLPDATWALWGAWLILLLQLVLLGLGVWPRLQAVCVFLWVVSFQTRGIFLFDGEDTVFRVMAFLVALLPLHRHTVIEWWRGRREGDGTWPIWPYRLIQLQLCLIFASTVLLKLRGATWHDGTAMWYVVHLDDLYGKVFNPPLLFGYLLPLKLMTWGTLVLEVAAPILIWFRRTRRATLAVLIAFHLGIDLSMNLNLFHPIMVLGWLSFLVEPLPPGAPTATPEAEPGPTPALPPG